MLLCLSGCAVASEASRRGWSGQRAAPKPSSSREGSVDALQLGVSLYRSLAYLARREDVEGNESRSPGKAAFRATPLLPRAGRR